jgi:hypothetical protein
MWVVVEVPGQKEVLVTQRRRQDVIGGASFFNREIRGPIKCGS